VVDQQSTNLVEGAAFLQSGQPMGQSFTPSLSWVDSIVLNLYDSDALHNSGATVYVNLRTNSITGTILGSTSPIFLPDGFSGTTNFIFSTSIFLVSGVTYYFQPVILSGNTIGSYVTDNSYTGGSAIYLGNPVSGNLWFQEGVLAVPEPSIAALLLVGSGTWFWSRRKHIF
jgi:hypothetical protein